MTEHSSQTPLDRRVRLLAVLGGVLGRDCDGVVLQLMPGAVEIYELIVDDDGRDETDGRETAFTALCRRNDDHARTERAARQPDAAGQQHVCDKDAP